MSELREEILEMPAGELGPENPLPPLPPPPRPPAPRPGRRARIDPSVSRADRKYFGFGGPTPVLPYHMQDDYTRARLPRPFRTVVLENEILRAEFLLELGGRLRSLLHKPSGREVLYVNPVFQPANLAVRNAWFSGGVEWNCGIRGHSPFTCSPLFAAELRRRDGCPVLRLWEWERVRGVTFQIDACLPPGSAFLLVHVRLVNSQDGVVPMYWWSNAAVPEAPGWRVLAPADSALRTHYGGGIGRDPVPPPDGPDSTYPTNLPEAADFFYRIPRGRRPWIAALDEQGKGLVLASTRRLKGRKLFVWGMGAGGRRWQEFLSVPGAPYVEVQAGLARTQYECLPMPARARWDWLEAYGLLEADAGAVHSPDAQAARDAVSARLEQVLPEAALNAELARLRSVADLPPARMIQRGSGWGALERRRREKSSEPPFCTPGTPFDEESLGPDQAPWLELLKSGSLPARGPGQDTLKSLVQAPWRARLEEAASRKTCDHWLAWLHLGIMRSAAGQAQAARQAWQESLARAPSPWALRNLAVLERQEGRAEESADLYLRAARMAPELAPLAVECLAALLQAGRDRQVLDLVAQLPPAVAALGRVRLIQARAAVGAGDLELAQRLLGALEVSDIREGDNVITETWFLLHERRLAAAEGVPIDEALKERVRRDFPPPRHLDYRMFRQKK